MKTIIKVLAWINAVGYTLALLSMMFNASPETVDATTVFYCLIILVQSILTIIYLSDTVWEIE